MSITPERKAELISEFGLKEGDTGSPEVQVAILTDRIKNLTEHMKEHKHDFHSRRGLLIMVGQRRSQLDYLRKKSEERYQSLIQRFGSASLRLHRVADRQTGGRQFCFMRHKTYHPGLGLPSGIRPFETRTCERWFGKKWGQVEATAVVSMGLRKNWCGRSSSDQPLFRGSNLIERKKCHRCMAINGIAVARM